MIEKNGGWAAIPNWMFGKASPNALLVFAALGFYANNETGWCVPSQKSIGESVGISVTSVKKALNELRDMGVVRWEQRIAGDGSATSNTYQIRAWVADWTNEPVPESEEGDVTLDAERLPLVTTDLPPSHSAPTPQACGGYKQEPFNKNHLTRSNSQLSADAEKPTPEQEELLDYLDAQIVAAGFKKPNRTKQNRSAIRLLLEKDGKTPEQVRACIDFTFRDEFWRSNIRSMSKLRQKWDQLKGARDIAAARRAPRRTRSEEAFENNFRQHIAAERPDLYFPDGTQRYSNEEHLRMVEMAPEELQIEGGDPWGHSIG